MDLAESAGRTCTVIACVSFATMDLHKGEFQYLSRCMWDYVATKGRLFPLEQSFILFHNGTDNVLQLPKTSEAEGRLNRGWWKHCGSRMPACGQELFGPLSMRALEEDQYVRQIEGYLPDATVAFIDEVFKANSAILNTLLTILNERLFDNGSVRSPVPLLCLVSISGDSSHTVSPDPPRIPPRMHLLACLLTSITLLQ